jgi:hypothetical protein
LYLCNQDKLKNKITKENKQYVAITEVTPIQIKPKDYTQEHDLQNNKNREKTILRASKDIVKHIKRELPLTVKRQDYLVVVSESNLTIETNVI